MEDIKPVWGIITGAASILMGVLTNIFIFHYQRKIKKGDEDRDKMFAKIETLKNEFEEDVIKLRKQLSSVSDKTNTKIEITTERLFTKLDSIKEESAQIKQSVIRISSDYAHIQKSLDDHKSTIGKVHVMETGVNRLETDIKRIFQHIDELHNKQKGK